MAKSIQEELDRDKFSMADFFPEHEEARPLNLPDNKVLFTTFLADFVNDGAFAYSTRKNYRSMVNLISPSFKGLLIGDINKAHVRRYRDMLVKNGTSNKTIKNRFGLMSAVFKHAIEAKLISENPATGLFLKVKKVQIVPFTPQEVKLILDEIDKQNPRITLYFAIGFFAGLRTGEILALERNDFDLENHKIRVSKTITVGRFKDSTKTGEDRLVDITELLDPYIERHFKLMETQLNNPDGHLFINHYGNRVMGYNTITEIYWRPALKKLGIIYRQPYHMRHTFTCQNIAAGEDLNWIRDMLGHESLEMLLNTYGKWLVKREGRAGGKFSKYLEEEIKDDGIFLTV
jgi:integrase